MSKLTEINFPTEFFRRIRRKVNALCRFAIPSHEKKKKRKEGEERNEKKAKKRKKETKEKQYERREKPIINRASRKGAN